MSNSTIEEIKAIIAERSDEELCEVWDSTVMEVAHSGHWSLNKAIALMAYAELSSRHPRRTATFIEKMDSDGKLSESMLKFFTSWGSALPNKASQSFLK